MVNHFDVADLLHTLSARCVELFDVDAAGLVVADRSETLRVLGSSGEQARMLELFEIQNDEGPCLDCYQTGETIVEEDLDSAERWRRFRQEALSAGFHSVEAVPMRLRDEVMGALNLFRAAPGRLDDADVAACRALADVATIGLLAERAVREARDAAEQLQHALNTRVVIEQAKGVLAERGGLDMNAAFELLRRAAHDHDLFLSDVAAAVIDGRLAVDELVSAAR